MFTFLDSYCYRQDDAQHPRRDLLYQIEIPDPYPFKVGQYFVIIKMQGML